MNKILFVGGPHDGYRKNDPRSIPTSTIHVFTPDCFLADPYVGDYYRTVPEATTYTVKRLRGDNGKIYEVAFDSSVQDCMEALIKGYRGHRNKRRSGKRT